MRTAGSSTNIQNASQNKSHAACLQCGQPVTGLHKFCCFGCETVYELQHGEGLPYDVNPRAPQKDWSYLQDPSFAMKIDLPQQGYQAKFFLENVHCASCLWVIERVARHIPEVQNTNFNMSESLLTVHAADTFALPKVASLLDATGFTPHPVRDEDELSDLKKQDLRSLQKRLGVAAFCAGNIMLLSVSVYGGLTGFLRPYFDWISFALFLPVATYASRDFMFNSWQALKQRRPSIDWPIALAIALGGALSFLNLLRGDGTVYFDSLSALVALLLGARLYLRSIQKKFLGGSHLRDFLAGQTVEVMNSKEDSENWKTVSAESLSSPQVFRLKAGQRVPVDARLLQNQANLDPSALTGESLPKNFARDDKVAAGYRALEESTVFMAESSIDSSSLGQTLIEAQDQLQERTRMTELTDRVAQWFTLGILLVAGSVFLAFAGSDLSTAIHRALAVVIIACPCALAFAAPLIHSLSLAKAQKSGLLIKSASTLEDISNARKIIFDKTGTLTSPELKVAAIHGAEINTLNLSILSSLEKKSFHPIARAIVCELDKREGVYEVELDEYKEVAGTGVAATYQGRQYAARATESGQVGLYRDGNLLFSLELSTEVLEDAQNVVEELRARDLHLTIASGDEPEKVLQIAQHLNIEDYHASLKPKDKTDLVEDGTIMVGDGINDLHSLSASSVGIAVNGALIENLKVSDVYFVDRGIAPLRTLFRLSDLSRNVLYGNIAFSVFYNVVGAGFAVFGLVSPLVAAALMPLSSTLVVASSVLGMRKEVRG